MTAVYYPLASRVRLTTFAEASAFAKAPADKTAVEKADTT